MEPIKLQLARLPRALGDLRHSNQFLKLSACAAYGLSFLLVVLLFLQSSKPPVVLALAPDGSTLEKTEMPQPEDEIRRAARAYVDLRYRWEPKTVAQRLHEAEAFISPATRKAYEAAAGNVSKFAIEKGVLQRVYPTEIKVVLETRTISILGDRVTAIQGLKAAGDLKLGLSFENGPRTRENPWGIYITKEKEE